MEKISFIISNYNTKNYTKLCYDSIRKNLWKEHEIVLLSDASTDGTNILLEEIHNMDKNTKLYINDESQIGIAYMYNKGVSMASNEIVCVLHSDMYIPPKFDERMLNHMNSGIDFLTAYRVEPPIYPASNDKYQKDFGITWDVFNSTEFIELSEELYKNNTGKLQKRTCFPWMTTKTVYDSVGGNDTLFLKYMVDDDDFYYRIMLKGYRYEQALDVCVYHFCSRSTKYENDQLNNNGSNAWNSRKLQKRTCFPWMTTKTVYDSVGGNDTLFLKYMVDDDDFYYRIMLKGYRYEQALDTCVYHFCSRSTKYENDQLNNNGSNAWNSQYMKSTKNFIRKWGFQQGMVYNSDMSLRRNISIKKCLIVPGGIPNMEFLSNIEPYYDTIIAENKAGIIKEYCNIEQHNTLISLIDKFYVSKLSDNHSLIIELKHNNITPEIIYTLINLPNNISVDTHMGLYESNDMTIQINRVIDVSADKIVNKRIFDKYE